MNRRIKISGLPYDVGIYEPRPACSATPIGRGHDSARDVPEGSAISGPAGLDMFVVATGFGLARARDRRCDDGDAHDARPPARPEDNFDAITQEVYVQAINSFTLVARVLMFALSTVGLNGGGHRRRRDH